MEYPGIDGFLGTRASFMLDVVFLAMFAVLPNLGFSIFLVKYRKRYSLHKKIQITLGVVLLIAVSLFEVDMRFISGWEERARLSPYYGTPDSSGLVFYTLYIHLFFAVTTTVLWILVIVRALRNFPTPPQPAEHSRKHIFWARLAAIDMFCTAITGWTFYWFAFVME